MLSRCCASPTCWCGGSSACYEHRDNSIELDTDWHGAASCGDEWPRSSEPCARPGALPTFAWLVSNRTDAATRHLACIFCQDAPPIARRRRGPSSTPPCDFLVRDIQLQHLPVRVD